MKSLIFSIFPDCGISVSAKMAIHNNGYDPKLTIPNVKWIEDFFYPFTIPDKRPVSYADPGFNLMPGFYSIY